MTFLEFLSNYQRNVCLSRSHAAVTAARQPSVEGLGEVKFVVTLVLLDRDAKRRAR